MKGKKIILILLVAAMSLLMINGIAMAETGKKTIDEIRRSLETSSLSQQAKAFLSKKAMNAVKTGIPPEDIQIIIDRSLKNGVDGRSIDSFLDTAIKVKEQNLPVETVLDRMQQGLSKGVPPEKILNATRGLAERLNNANSIVNGVVRSGVRAASNREREEAIKTVARAVESSISENIIAQTGTKMKQHNHPLSMFNMAINTMSILAGNGIPMEHASRLVNSAIDRGYSERDMLRMEKELFDGLREGRPMEDSIKKMDSLMNRRGFGEEHRGMESGNIPGSGMSSGAGSDHRMGTGSGTGSSPNIGGGHPSGPGYGRGGSHDMGGHR